MDATSQRIVEIVGEWNAERKEICLKDLMKMKLAAPPTIHKKVNELLTSRELIGQQVQTPHGTKRLLFLPGNDETAEGTITVNLLGMINYNLSRLADAVELGNTDTGVPRIGRKRADDGGRMQTKLQWSEKP